MEKTAEFLLWAVVFFALISMAQYFREFWIKLKDRIKADETRRIKILERRKQRAAERRELERLRKLEKLRQQTWERGRHRRRVNE